jgi:hypothetical protein
MTNITRNWLVIHIIYFIHYQSPVHYPAFHLLPDQRSISLSISGHISDTLLAALPLMVC